MSLPNPEFSIGVEEEYLIVDKESRDLVVDPPQDVVEACLHSIEGQVSPEFLRCQIEVGTRVCQSVSELRDELRMLRGNISGILDEAGMALISSSSHPFGKWQNLRHTDKERYNELARDIGEPINRMMICGMHVHVGIGDDDLRIDLMNQARYFLPHLLSLSTSSPFWEGRDTGLMSYRLSVFRSLPRTGIAPDFSSYSEYRRHVNALVGAGVIQDATKIWWDIRPSDRFPTLEMRVADACTNMEDSLTIAALYLCTLRMLYRLRRNNVSWRKYKSMLIEENRWRAQRYGADQGLIDFGRQEIVPYQELLEEWLGMIAEDAAALDCTEQLDHARTIVKRGTSAHTQKRVYNEAMANGASQEEALKAVVDWLIEETMAGISANDTVAANKAARA